MNRNKTKSHTGLWILFSLCFLALMAAILAYAGTKGNDGIRQRDITWTDAGFDTPITFSATASEKDFETYAKTVKDIFMANNALFDQYNTYQGVNNIKTLNEQAADHPVQVDENLITILQEAARYNALNPKFDVTEGKIISLWHDAREADTPYVPAEADVKAAKDHTGMEGVTIQGNRVSFTDDSIQLDLGGIAKGWTAGLAAETLQDMGLDNGYINAGGNVVLLGEKTDGSDWVIGIQSPDSSESVVQLVTQKPVVMVTSGDYQRYMEVDGKRYSHIIDPDTGYPADHVRSVTVIGNDSGKADAESTTLFLMPLDQSMAYAQEHGIQAVWITDKGQEERTPDLQTPQYDIYLTEGLKDQIRLSQ